MTFDEAYEEIYAGIVATWPDRLGGALTIAETAEVIRRKFGSTRATEKSSYEIVRRSLASMDVPVKTMLGGKRIMVKDLVTSLARMVCTEDIEPIAARRRAGGFRDHKLDLTRKSPRGAVTPSTVGFATRLPPDGPWPLRPDPQELVFVPRTDFPSELAKVRYMRKIERMEAFWQGVRLELDKLEAADREARAQAITLPPRKRPIHSS